MTDKLKQESHKMFNTAAVVKGAIDKWDKMVAEALIFTFLRIISLYVSLFINKIIEYKYRLSRS